MQVLLLNSVVPRVNGRSWMVVLCDVETDAVPSFLVRQSVDTSTDRQRRVRLGLDCGAKVIDERPTLRSTKEAGALEYD